MEPSAVPPPPPGHVPADGPATPTAGAGIADTRFVVTSYAPIAACEFVGTAVLVMIGPGAAILAGEQIGTLGIALAFGFAWLAMSYVIGPISGGHINPAVTLGMWLTRRITLRHAVYAWAAQVLGGIFGAAVIYGIASGRDGWERGPFFANGWDRDGLSGLGAAIVVELVFTAVLVFVVLSATGRRFAAGFGGLVTGIMVAAIHLVTIPVDNTGINPARSIATAVFADASPNALGQLWVFILFPLIGSVVGVFVWLLVDPATLETTLLDTDMLRRTRDVVEDLVDDAFEEDDDETTRDATEPGP